MWKAFALAGKIQSRASEDGNNCDPAAEDIESYNLTLRIVSIFVLLVASVFGASLAVVSARVKRLRINPIIINTGKFFGTEYKHGLLSTKFYDVFYFSYRVILATGFIHMLPSAMEALTDECLPDDWLAYEAYAGLFAMLAILVMQLIEFIAHHQLHRTLPLNKVVTTTEGVPPPDISSVEHCEEIGQSWAVSFARKS